MKLVTEGKVFATGICTLMKSSKKDFQTCCGFSIRLLNAQWHLQSINENRHEITLTSLLKNNR